MNDDAGAALDLTDATFIWALSKKASDSVAPKGTSILSKSIGSGIAVTDVPNGILEITIDPADTDALAGDYYHELQMTQGGNISTVLYGQATIVKDLI